LDRLHLPVRVAKGGEIVGRQIVDGEADPQTIGHASLSVANIATVVTADYGFPTLFRQAGIPGGVQQRGAAVRSHGRGRQLSAQSRHRPKLMMPVLVAH